MRRALRRAALLGAGLAVAFAAAAPAVIPRADKIAQAVAEANRRAGRAEPLLLEVSLRIGSSEILASGSLASHPTGLARLELVSRRGFVERHLLQGNDYRVSRDGQLLDATQRLPLLAPVFLLQASSGAALAAALESFGVAADTAVLGRVGDHDCYVLGGRPSPANEREGRRLGSLWVDVESYEVVRVDRADGVRIDFGPPGRFGEIQAPRWIEIDVPGEDRARLEVQSVVRADAPAAAFGADWLTAASPP